MPGSSPIAWGNPRTHKQNPALSRLEIFVGEWRMEAFAGGKSMGGGRAVFEWEEGGAFLAERAEPEQPQFPAVTAVISRDNASQAYCMLYFDSRGVSRVYQMSLGDGVWKLWRDAPGFSQRFTGTFRDDGRTISGRWEKSRDGSHWEHDFDLTYTKVQ